MRERRTYYSIEDLNSDNSLILLRLGRRVTPPSKYLANPSAVVHGDYIKFVNEAAYLELTSGGHSGS